MINATTHSETIVSTGAGLALDCLFMIFSFLVFPRCLATAPSRRTVWTIV
jgi:hypothetical protein